MSRRMIKQIGVAGLMLIIGGAANVHASDADHFEGKASETVEQAVENLTVYTEELKTLAAGDLGSIEMARVHEVTYTLENALARINQEYESVAAALEEVHLASERVDTDTVRKQASVYAEGLSELIPKN